MKNLFLKPELEVYKLTCSDVVCTSLGPNEEDLSKGEGADTNDWFYEC